MGDAPRVPNFQLCMLTSQGFLCAPSTNRLHGNCTAPLDTTSLVSHTAWVGGVGKTHKGWWSLAEGTLGQILIFWLLFSNKRNAFMLSNYSSTFMLMCNAWMTAIYSVHFKVGLLCEPIYLAAWNLTPRHPAQPNNVTLWEVWATFLWVA